MSRPSPPEDRAAAFASLYDDVYDDVLRFAQRRVDPSRAEDVVADTFLVVWRRFDEVPAGRGPARAWTFGIARHVLLNTHRGTTRRRSLGVRVQDVGALDAGVVGGTGADPQADLVAARIDLARAWVRLSAVHQEALGLTVLDGLTSPQAAEVLGISPVAFRLRLTRARRALHALVSVGPPTSPLPAAATTHERTS